MEKRLEEILKPFTGKRESVIQCLQAVMDEFGYIPKLTVKVISGITGVPDSEIFGVLTFYSQFTLTPKAKYNIEVCMGTACFVLGNASILDVLTGNLKIGLGETTPDGKFSIAQSRCLGCCGFAPVIAINGRVYGEMTVEKVNEVLSDCK